MSDHSSLEESQAKALAEFDAAADLAALDAARVAHLGKSGTVAGLMARLGKLPPDEKRAFGQAVNSVKQALEARLAERQTVLKAKALEARLASERIDISLPVEPQRSGKIHPISQTIDEIVAIFGEMGFSVAEGPDIEDDFHNFTALNLAELVNLGHIRPSQLLTTSFRNRAGDLHLPILFEAGMDGNEAHPQDDQQKIIVGVRVGDAIERNWRGTGRSVDAFDAKSDLFFVLRLLGLNPDDMSLARDAPDWFHPGQSGSVKLGPKQVLGNFGMLHPEVGKRYDLDAPVAVFELHLDAVPPPKTKAGRDRPMLKTSTFQAVQRDFAFMVDKSVEVETLLRAVRTADKALISSVALFDVYEGKAVPEGQKSVALTVTLTPMDRTLTDAEIETVATAITSAVAKATGGTLRS